MTDDSLTLGAMLLDAGVVTGEELARARAYQLRHNCKIGLALVETGAVKPDTIERFLVAQQGRRARRSTIRFESALTLAQLTREALKGGA